MGLKKLLLKPLSGYPGDYRKMRRGSQGFDQTPPFRKPDDWSDRRSRIPPTGTGNTGIPPLPDKDVKKTSPKCCGCWRRRGLFPRQERPSPGPAGLVPPPLRLSLYGPLLLPRLRYLPLPRRHL